MEMMKLEKMFRKYRQCILSLSRNKHQQSFRRAIQQLHCQLIFAPKSTSNTTIELEQYSSAKKNSLTELLGLWNFILRQYALGLSPQEAVFLFQHLQGHHQVDYFFDSFTYSFLIKASANLIQSGLGKQLHCLIYKAGFQEHIYVQTALIDMYMKCGCLVEAGKVFDEMPQKNLVTWNALLTGFIRWGDLGSAQSVFNRMPQKNVVSWTAMIDGYTRMRQFDKAFSLFQRMLLYQGIKPTEVTLLAIFPAIWNLRHIEFCGLVHAYGEKSGYNASDVRVMNCLIDAYAKCGSIEYALRVFQEISDERKNIVTWTSIISGFAMHGMAEEASKSFSWMLHKGLKPNPVTFLTVLNACSHGGLVEEGLEFFRRMVNEYDIVPGIKHYGSVIDMLGRAGRLEEAEKIAMEIPMDIGNVVVWRTLLGACSFHGNVEMGEKVTRIIMEMERQYGGDYILLSNIFAGVGRYMDSERVRRHMDKKNAAKVAGLSFV